MALFGRLATAPALVLAVSGGPDSTALLWLAARWRDALSRAPRLVAVTIDHGLRKESAREAQTVKRLARRLEVEHRTLRWTGRKPRTGIQEAARNARYRLLAAAAQEAGARYVVTAHTLDDQAETVLFRLARASGIGGLAAMRALTLLPVADGRRMGLARPLLTVPKARLIATLKAAKLPYARDPSNFDPRFTRPRLRKLMPALAREGLTADRLAQLARRAERAEAALAYMLDRVTVELWPADGPPGEPAIIPTGAFRDLPAELGVRLLERLVRLLGGAEPELGQLETLHAALNAAGEGPFRCTLAGAMVTLSGKTLRVERAPPRREAKKPRQAKAPFTKPR